jgi:hypothetical protein
VRLFLHTHNLLRSSTACASLNERPSTRSNTSHARTAQTTVMLRPAPATVFGLPWSTSPSRDGGSVGGSPGTQAELSPLWRELLLLAWAASRSLRSLRRRETTADTLTNAGAVRTTDRPRARWLAADDAVCLVNRAFRSPVCNRPCLSPEGLFKRAWAVGNGTHGTLYTRA